MSTESEKSALLSHENVTGYVSGLLMPLRVDLSRSLGSQITHIDVRPKISDCTDMGDGKYELMFSVQMPNGEPLNTHDPKGLNLIEMLKAAGHEVYLFDDTTFILIAEKKKLKKIASKAEVFKLPRIDLSRAGL